MCTVVDGRASIRGVTTTIPNIQLIRVLPPGRNGAVFEGRDNLGRRVAVKIWFRSGRSTASMGKQARAEASKIASISHRYIGSVYAAQELEDGKFCMVMEFIEGETLREYLRSKRTLFERYRIWGQISDAIFQAHGAGIFHGDLHDRNILVTPEGARVIDFGTSIFQRTKTNARQRESVLLEKLVRQLVSEDDPSAIWDIPFHELSPEICLAASNAFVEFVYLASTPAHDIFEDYMEGRNLAFKLGLVVEKHPYFTIEKLLNWLARKDLPRLDRPLVQYLHAALPASLKGRRSFTIAALDGPLDSHIGETEQWRKELVSRYLSGQRSPSSYLAEWHSFF